MCVCVCVCVCVSFDLSCEFVECACRLTSTLILWLFVYRQFVPTIPSVKIDFTSIEQSLYEAKSSANISILENNE